MILTFNPRQRVSYPFPSERNPHAPEMDAGIPEMIEALYPFLPEKAREKYRETHIGYCAGCIFPRGDLAHLQAICSVFIWAFAIDDKFERSTPETIFSIRDTALPILLGQAPAINHPLFNGLPKMREYLLTIAGQEWLEKRFCKNLGLYFSGLADETHYRNNGIYPDMGTYLHVRLRSVNVDIMTNLAEAVTARLLPDVLTGHKVIREIELLVCRILIWCNDLFSADEERENKDVLNSILIIEHFQQCSPYEAAMKVQAMHDEDVCRLQELISNLPDFGMYNPVVRNYVANLSFMISGYLDWTLNFTGRYSAGGHAAAEMQALVS